VIALIDSLAAKVLRFETAEVVQLELPVPLDVEAAMVLRFGTAEAALSLPSVCWLLLAVVVLRFETTETVHGRIQGGTLEEMP
jgi:hypothetical protein